MKYNNIISHLLEIQEYIECIDENNFYYVSESNSKVIERTLVNNVPYDENGQRDMKVLLNLNTYNSTVYLGDKGNITLDLLHTLYHDFQVRNIYLTDSDFRRLNKNNELTQLKFNYGVIFRDITKLTHFVNQLKDTPIDDVLIETVIFEYFVFSSDLDDLVTRANIDLIELSKFGTTRVITLSNYDIIPTVENITPFSDRLEVININVTSECTGGYLANLKIGNRRNVGILNPLEIDEIKDKLKHREIIFVNGMIPDIVSPPLKLDGGKYSDRNKYYNIISPIGMDERDWIPYVIHVENLRRKINDRQNR